MKQGNEKVKQPWSTTKKILVAALAVAFAALLFVAARLLYVMFVDPMRAFGQAMVTPAPTATLMPVPTQT
ncbi:MAG: hypothetical protein PHO41_07745, partial [Eubacteriales bacterium]|nr:hypothetical protein [Eubacteriales bacterium]